MANSLWLALLAVPTMTLTVCERPVFCDLTIDGPSFTRVSTLGDSALGLALGGPTGVRIDLLDQQTGEFGYATTLFSPQAVIETHLADVNGDGKEDIVVTHHNGVGVFLYDATQGPAPYRNYQVLRASLGNSATEPVKVAMHDMNADAAADLIVGRSAVPVAVDPTDTTEMHLYLNNGSGAFDAAPITYKFPSAAGSFSRFVSSVFGAALDADPVPEVAVLNGQSLIAMRFTGAALVPIVAATGADFAGPANQFQSQCGTAFPAEAAISVDVGADGLTDFYSGSLSNIRLLRATGNRMFAPAQVFSSGTESVIHLAAGDLDADGDADVVATRPGLAGVTVWSASSSGALSNPMSYSVGEVPVGSVILPPGPAGSLFALPSLAVGLGAQGAVVGVPTAGSSRFFTSQRIASASGMSTRIALGDLNQDGATDIICGAGAGMNVYFNRNDGTGTVHPTAVTYSVPSSSVTGLCFVPPGPQTGGARFAFTTSTLVALMKQTGPGTLTPTPLSFDGRPTGVRVAAGDLTGDGNPEIVVLHASANDTGVDASVFTYNAGTASYTTPSSATNLSISKIQLASDWWQNQAGARLFGAIYKGPSNANDRFAVLRFTPGAGSFTVEVASTHALSAPGSSVASADFNTDGEADFAILDAAGMGYQIVKSTGPGAWSAPTSHAFSGHPAATWLEAGLLDADALPDLAIVFSNGSGAHGRMVVYPNVGNGAFASEGRRYLVGANPGPIAFANMHADSRVRGRSPASDQLAQPEAVVGVAGALSFTPVGLQILPGVATPDDAPSCPADLNGDDQVDDADFLVFLAAYNLLDCADPSMPPTCPSDFNADNAVDDADFLIFLPAYNALVCP